FAYRPETGEERFHSFAGVPIIRLESPIGVLAVQHAEPRRYENVEIEALQTVAMVLSELIAGARLVDGARRGRVGGAGPLRLSGLKLVAGMARGEAVFHEPRVLVEHTVAEDTEAERDRVYSAFRRMREQIDNMARDAEFGTTGEHQEILETYRMFAYDEGWSRRINEAIDSGLTAEAAIERVQQRTRARMQEIDDPLLQERMHDLEDLSNRLLRIVSGRMGTAAQTGLARDAVLIARNLPAKTKDGVHVGVMVNAGLAEDAAALDMTGADGIGLFRTEFQFLVSATLPGRERQQRLYAKVLQQAGSKPVIFRTVDIGG